MLSEYFESANSFTYNGINSLDMGLFITGQSAADSAAEPEIETVEVPAKRTTVYTRGTNKRYIQCIKRKE